MGESLYHLLGVDRDADEASIRRAYRERIKNAHPDVSDDPDAAAEFKRLTTAREVLLDDGARARYDRLGHEGYVAAELDDDLWTGRSEGPADPDPKSSTWETGNAAWRRDGPTRARGQQSPSAGVTDGGSATATGTETTSGRHRYRARGVETETRSPLDRIRASLSSMGPWLFVHAVFLVSAAGASGSLAASTVSIPALSLPLGTGLFGLALALSALHVVSVLYV